MEPVLTARSSGFWLEHLGRALPSRPRLLGTVDADVCIVGAGYTGLWTAWALLRSAPDLKVVLVEAEHAGFGASGRNGGWLSGLLPGSRDRLAAGAGGRAGVVALQRTLVEAVPSIGSILAAEGIDCDFHQGGTLAVAVNQAQLARLRAGVDEDRRWGLSVDDVRLLDACETSARVRIAGAVGSVYSPHCARIQPARLVHGLAEAVEKRGATICEHSPARSVRPGRVDGADGAVRAPWVVLATEGYTCSLPSRRRKLLPMNSSMIATPPLPPEVWAAVGWDGMETVSDGAHAYVYMQRTSDGRVAVGGRGVPYRYGSRAGRSTSSSSAATPPSTVAALEGALRRMFPGVAPELLRAERAWSGVLGVARDWCPSILVTAAGGAAERGAGGGGLVTAGGYVGDGVTTSHVAGLTVADLILGRDTPRTRLPWVGRNPRDWEPEPLRWIGVRTVYSLYRAADRREGARPEDPRPSGWARVADRLAGRR